MHTRPLRDLFEAVHHGKFSFDDFLAMPIGSNYEKVNWPGRRVFKPSKRLKVYHAFLNRFLFEHLPANEKVSFAYRKGINPHAALLPHANSRAFYQTDLRKFFDSIDAELIRKVLSGAATTPVQDLQHYLDRIVELVTIDELLAIGFSTSPTISNACMKLFDDAFEMHCFENGLIYTRYADDIIVSSKSREALESIDKKIAEFLLSCMGDNFQLNPLKSKLTTIGRKVTMLGMVILPTGRVTVDMDLKRKVETQLHFYMHDRNKLLNLLGEDMETGLRRLAGHISYINAADPRYLDKLRRKYGVTVIDSFLHRSAS
jgi:RNA-directed DNA polymerase